MVPRHFRGRAAGLGRGLCSSGITAMIRRWFWSVMVCVSLVGLLTGCDKLPFGKSAATSDLDDEFADLDGPPKTGDEPSATATPVDLTATPQEFALKLEVGQRFPLVKTIEQRLTQQLATGPTVGHSRLELTLSLQVEEVRGPRQRLAVRYHRVRYAQDLGGQYVDFDSSNPAAQIAPAALAYAGLKDNGFSFWLGADNRVGELIGFAEFLQRCVSGLSSEQRPQALAQLQSLRSDDGLANFVDDSIGLLPSPSDPQLAGQSLRIGTVWQKSAAEGDGLRCLLKELTAQSAEISLIGTIPPAIYVDPAHQMKLTVRGGQLTGSCVVDRTTGMPTQSRVERSIEMVAQLADGSEIPQRKEVLTTVTAFLDQHAATNPYASAAPGVQPASYQQPAAYQPPANSAPTWGQGNTIPPANNTVRPAGYP